MKMQKTTNETIKQLHYATSNKPVTYNAVYNGIYNKFIDEFCKSVNVERSAVFSLSRDDDFINLRYPVFYVLRLQGLTYKEISNICLHYDISASGAVCNGDKRLIHHSTVKYACEKIGYQKDMYKSKTGVIVDLALSILHQVLQDFKTKLNSDAELLKKEKLEISVNESEFIENIATLIESI